MARATMAWPMLSVCEMRHILEIFAHVGVVQAVAGVDLQAQRVGVRGGAAVPGEFLVARRARGRIGVAAGVQLDDLRAAAMGGVDLRRSRRR